MSKTDLNLINAEYREPLTLSDRILSIFLTESALRQRQVRRRVARERASLRLIGRSYTDTPWRHSTVTYR